MAENEEGVYRGTVDRLGESEREEEAVRDFGAWRDRTNSLALAVFGGLGVIPSGLAAYFVTEWQLDHNHGVASMKGSAGIAAAVWFGMFIVGKLVGRRLVRSRTSAKLTELAAAYAIPLAGLEQIASMVNEL
ncbi:MAG TPA: hypothetical protein VGM90_27550 [Kofleriaceae bacterium]|jgi:hypothetical protein